MLNEARNLLQIRNLEKVWVINRYDAENLPEELFHEVINTVFSEPQVDVATSTLNAGPEDTVFAVEYLPGQFDARAASAEECIQLISKGERPTVKSAKVYILTGSLSEADVDEIKRYLINPVEAREASLDPYETLKVNYEIPTKVETLDGFRELNEAGLEEFLQANGLAMDLADLAFVQEYFTKEQRDPTITEIKVIDTYWSDHCRHTTYNTTLDSIEFHDARMQKTYEDYLNTRKELGRTKPVNLMDIGTLAAKYLRKNGMLEKLDAS